MIISKKYAKQLVREGRAKIDGKLIPDGRGIVYVVITRYDIQRTDHYQEDLK